MNVDSEKKIVFPSTRPFWFNRACSISHLFPGQETGSKEGVDSAACECVKTEEFV